MYQQLQSWPTPEIFAGKTTGSVPVFWTPPSFDLQTALGFTLGVTDLNTFDFVDVGNLAGLLTIAFPMTSSSSIFLSSELDITDITGLSIATINTLTLNNLPAINNILFPALVNVTDSIDIENNNVDTFDFTSLKNVANEFVLSGNQASDFILPNLLNVGGDFNYHDDANIINISFPALTNALTITTVNDIQLQTLLLPLLATLTGGNFNCGNCQSLTTVDIGAVIIADGSTIDFSGDNLDVTSINAILRRCVVSGLTTSDIELANGTNAAPTGQGLLDKATLLLSPGNTVNTN